MTIYGYARVSTRDQDLIAQDAELMAAGCAKVFKEKISGAKTDRPELAKGIRRLEPGERPDLPHAEPAALPHREPEGVRGKPDGFLAALSAFAAKTLLLLSRLPAPFGKPVLQRLPGIEIAKSSLKDGRVGLRRANRNQGRYQYLLTCVPRPKS
jgi:hypothetical protein